MSAELIGPPTPAALRQAIERRWRLPWRPVVPQRHDAEALFDLGARTQRELFPQTDSIDRRDL